MTFFQLVVGDFFGGKLLAFFGIMALYIFIGILGRMSFMLLITMLSLYIVVFATGFLGVFAFIIMFIASGVYFFINFIKWAT